VLLGGVPGVAPGKVVCRARWRTSTFALNNATLPFVLALANKGWRAALAEDVHLRHGL
jgi:alanine dehydrogenase